MCGRLWVYWFGRAVSRTSLGEQNNDYLRLTWSRVHFSSSFLVPLRVILTIPLFEAFRIDYGGVQRFLSPKSIPCCPHQVSFPIVLSMTLSLLAAETGHTVYVPTDSSLLPRNPGSCTYHHRYPCRFRRGQLSSAASIGLPEARS